jgi:hypothetical protein
VSTPEKFTHNEPFVSFITIIRVASGIPKLRIGSGTFKTTGVTVVPRKLESHYRLIIFRSVYRIAAAEIGSFARVATRKIDQIGDLVA